MSERLRDSGERSSRANHRTVPRPAAVPVTSPLCPLHAPSTPSPCPIHAPYTPTSLPINSRPTPQPTSPSRVRPGVQLHLVRTTTHVARLQLVRTTTYDRENPESSRMNSPGRRSLLWMSPRSMALYHARKRKADESPQDPGKQPTKIQMRLVSELATSIMEKFVFFPV